MAGTYSYYRYQIDTTNGKIGTFPTLVVVEEADGNLYDAQPDFTPRDTFVVAGTTYTFTGAFPTMTDLLYGSFTASITGGAFLFSHIANLPIGFDVDGTVTNGVSSTGYIGTIGTTTSGTGTQRNSLFVTLTCFLAGTMIRTPGGDVAVETLEIGQRVSLADGRTLPVKFIGRQTIAPIFADPLKTTPICIKAGALDDNVPSRDLYTSAGHAMLVDGALVVASALVNGRSIVRAELTDPLITYYHVELDEHAVIFANDAATETYCDNVPRAVFDNAAEFKALYPDAKPIRQLDLPTVKSQRQLPAATRQRLAARATVLAGSSSKAA